MKNDLSFVTKRSAVPIKGAHSTMCFEPQIPLKKTFDGNVHYKPVHALKVNIVSLVETERK